MQNSIFVVNLGLSRMTQKSFLTVTERKQVEKIIAIVVRLWPNVDKTIEFSILVYS